MEGWNSQRSAELYRILDWGSGYFSINQKGNVEVRPSRNGAASDLFELTRSLQRRGIEAPILFRFDGIVRDRTLQLQEAFREAISLWEYKGTYHATYPVKVNQQRHVVETVRKSGVIKNMGLEVGSKPELLAVLSIHDLPDAPLLCNGYKDDEYIELALLGRKLGRRSIIIIEQPYELAQVLRISAQVGIEAEVGVRMKPTTKSAGLWTNSSGDQAKFGLNTHEILTAIKLLKDQGKSDWLKLVHYHIGSQVPSIAAVKKVLKEATRMFVEIAQMCPSVEFFDIGGGLGVDYDGSNTNFESSMNYSIAEYAESVVSAIFEACLKAGVKHPNLVSESGRALVAHHAVLVMEAIDFAPVIQPNGAAVSVNSDHELLTKLIELHDGISVKNCHESLNEALTLKDDILEQFISGDLSLSERADAEKLFRNILSKISTIAKGLKYIPEDFEKLDEVLRDTLFCNFSVFQSIPDSWAIDQLFPVMPIQRLDEEPNRKSIIADLTCDSDGEISRFIDQKDVKNHLMCHIPKDDEPYFLGIFLIGAYQEILGDLHNLFGDTNAVHVEIGPDGGAEIVHVVKGDTVREVLEYVEYDYDDLINQFRLSMEKAIRDGGITIEESARVQKRYKEALDGYTYLVK